MRPESSRSSCRVTRLPIDFNTLVEQCEYIKSRSSTEPLKHIDDSMQRRNSQWKHRSNISQLNRITWAPFYKRRICRPQFLQQLLLQDSLVDKLSVPLKPRCGLQCSNKASSSRRLHLLLASSSPGNALSSTKRNKTFKCVHTNIC